MVCSYCRLGQCITPVPTYLRNTTKVMPGMYHVIAEEDRHGSGHYLVKSLLYIFGTLIKRNGILFTSF